ncbi:hypothetical protein GWO43_23785 [candidate division KSB1 bacterium]|nr:hypothetical protein [candidate division KSB1 bacterium]NIR73291.1 hypothetical protein [candidate division KSB1 bacterium]NIS26997.1 hypothetical protein [candidate division KSB1 bacterium]NIT73837.1 hypothetical protein [candidate division KSB1 bacterium]NIU27742.1 hypothetical protein [candidate division KSB1 bacterium]
MNCKKADKYLAAWVDDELKGWWLRRRISRHLEKCAFCQKMLEIQRQIKALLATKVKHVKAPPDLSMKVRVRLDQAMQN